MSFTVTIKCDKCESVNCGIVGYGDYYRSGIEVYCNNCSHYIEEDNDYYEEGNKFGKEE